jgi:23S rRNA pseudouridine1911/1915/1917 synthase
MAQQYKVEQQSELLEFLFSSLEGWAKKSVKQRLQNGSVRVNGMVIKKHNHLLKIGDIIEIDSAKQTKPITHDTAPKLEIIYRDDDLIAINKPAGLLSVGTTSENKLHALFMLREQLSRGKDEVVKLWPVHRLDRDTSGVLLFATSKMVREMVMNDWASCEKIYLAIVRGTPKGEGGTINQPIRMDENEYRMHVGKHPDAKPAITHYKFKKGTPKHTLLEVRIETGRQHQIRAHMAWLGHSVVGDERYGKKGDRMGLHSFKLSIVHPVSKMPLTFEIDAPKDFYALMEQS